MHRENDIKIASLFTLIIVFVAMITACVVLKVPIGDDKKTKISRLDSLARKGLRLVAILPISIRGDGKDKQNTGLEQNEMYQIFYSALKERGYKVVSQQEVELALKPFSIRTKIASNRTLIKNLGHELGIDGVIAVEIKRFNHDTWQSYSHSEKQRASAHIILSLYNVRHGKKVWHRVFNESQQPLFANMAHAAKYPGRGTHWLSDREFATWGVLQLVGALAEDCPPHNR